jgi:GNAT superfamily N-acetyltransferase
MIVLDDDKARLDVDRIHGWLASSYWSPGLDRAVFERAIAGSHCLGAYDGETQVGFARMITDHATFAWLADVWVADGLRGEGIGRKMVQWFLNHPQIGQVRRMMLVTRDAQGVYAPLGFEALARPDRLMERLSPELVKLIAGL